MVCYSNIRCSKSTTLRNKVLYLHNNFLYIINNCMFFYSTAQKIIYDFSNLFNAFLKSVIKINKSYGVLFKYSNKQKNYYVKTLISYLWCIFISLKIITFNYKKYIICIYLSLVFKKYIIENIWYTIFIGTYHLLPRITFSEPFYS